MTTKVMIVLALIAMACTCKKQTAGPDETPPAEPDTTSHDIMWRVDTIGRYGSILRDVAIINDSLIWAVGELTDSVSELYGAAIWNGKEWKLKKLETNTGSKVRPYGIWAFSENNIWLASGTILRYRNSVLKRVWANAQSQGPYTKVWAANESSIFFVGMGGAALHYNGSTFTEMDTGTDIDLTDVWGTSANDVWACGYTEFSGNDGTVIIHYNGIRWSTFHKRSRSDYRDLDTTIISGPAISVWTDSPKYFFTNTYWGLYKISSNTSTDFIRYIEAHTPPYRKKIIRGIHRNDIILCGAFTSIWHFNGKTAAYYIKVEGSGIFIGIAINTKLIVVVGQEYKTSKAIIALGKRDY